LSLFSNIKLNEGTGRASPLRGLFLATLLNFRKVPFLGSPSIPARF
jgi:hypothetical protein